MKLLFNNSQNCDEYQVLYTVVLMEFIRRATYSLLVTVDLLIVQAIFHYFVHINLNQKVLF